MLQCKGFTSRGGICKSQTQLYYARLEARVIHASFGRTLSSTLASLLACAEALGGTRAARRMPNPSPSPRPLAQPLGPALHRPLRPPLGPSLGHPPTSKTNLSYQTHHGHHGATVARWSQVPTMPASTSPLRGSSDTHLVMRVMQCKMLLTLLLHKSLLLVLYSLTQVKGYTAHRWAQRQNHPHQCFFWKFAFCFEPT